MKLSFGQNVAPIREKQLKPPKITCWGTKGLIEGVKWIRRKPCGLEPSLVDIDRYWTQVAQLVGDFHH